MRVRIIGNDGLENAKEKGTIIQALIKNEEIIKVGISFIGQIDVLIGLRDVLNN